MENTTKNKLKNNSLVNWFQTNGHWNVNAKHPALYSTPEMRNASINLHSRSGAQNNATEHDIQDTNDG
ncbi:MAG: hypothetical protein K2X81_17440 [Candidatus Obscuribacterales bacterium]|nr:hypothetical protein [Candidatus Obscuribacterales bacterium]